MSYLVHDIIKMKYIRMGYLPNHPYHLISDMEMCDAFLCKDENRFCYFRDHYPLPSPIFQEVYDELVDNLYYHLEELKKFEAINSGPGEIYILPDWVYTYMIGSTLGINSDKRDIHDMLVLMNMDNMDDEFTPEIHSACLEISTNWLKKLPRDSLDHRSPTIYGEPHVIKSLRLSDVRPDRV